MPALMPEPLRERWSALAFQPAMPAEDGYAAARGAAVFTATGDLTNTPIGAVASPRSWSDVVEELFDLRKLEDDWDGEGTPAPGASLVDSALILAKQLQQRNAPPPDRVHASLNGSVYFEWDEPTRYTEYELVAPDRVEIRSVPRSTGG